LNRITFDDSLTAGQTTRRMSRQSARIAIVRYMLVGMAPTEMKR
jgi:hypothetical protein